MTDYRVTPLYRVTELVKAEARRYGVQVIGSKFVLFKQNEKDPKIVLINDRKGKK